jgi:hypothetical protein
MNLKPFLLAAALAACAAATAQPIDVPAAGTTRSRLLASDVPVHVAAFAEAVGLYRAGRWSAAYGRLMPLADRGHVDAARILIVMLRYGRELHGTEWTASPSQVRTWERMVRSDGPLQLAFSGE